MGGFAGHMMHLNDNPNLTFGQIKDILEKAAGGELKGTEKTDGQNLFVSYSVRAKEARAVRNKGEAAKGGLSPFELAQKFADRGNLTETFVESFDAFERAVQNMPIETQVELFGPDANVFYNAEIMNPSSANVINYDTKNLVIHRVGHVKRDGDKITGLGDDFPIEKLEAALENAQEQEAQDDYKVQVNAIRLLERISDKKHLDIALKRMKDFMAENNLRDSDTIGDYLVSKTGKIVDNYAASLDEETKTMLVKRMLGQKGESLTKIKARIPKEAEDLRNIVGQLVKDSKIILKKSLFTLEDIIHDYAVEALRGMESAFVLDNEKEVQRLRNEVALAKKAIEDSNSEEAMEILNRQMSKLKDLENVATATEGFVFDYDGNTYKFTGTFAPVNQILGLFKYGRGNVPPLMKEQEDKTAVFIYPGRFQPMGKHHAETYRAIADNHGAENTYIATSDKVDLPKSPFNFEEKKEIMIRHGIPADKIIKVKNPYNAKELLDNYDTDVVKAVYFVGQKDMDEDPRFKKTSGVSKDGYDWEIKVAPHVSLDVDGYGEMSGTSLRKALRDADEEEFEKIMGFFDPAIHQLILQKLNELEEISMMSAAGPSIDSDVEGYSSPIKKRKEKEGYIMREEMIHELKLREVIRKRIKNKLKENKENGIMMLNESQQKSFQNFQEEVALRKVIRKLILQEKSEPVPHSNTGINQLSDLLKKIVPILSVGYKSLTSAEEQRASYRSHILNAVINSLAPIKAEDDIEPEALEEEEVDIDIENDEEKFIDIDGAQASDEEEASFQTLPGKDLTGRNVAMKDFDRIERIIMDAYEVLGDQKDQDLFYDYLITNLKLYFDKFEEELQSSPEEPTTQEYEQEKQADISASEPVSDDLPDEEELDVEL